MQIYQLKIILMDISPAIWRRVLVPADITLDRLHRVIQTTMDWYDSPLHEFHTEEKHYGTWEPDDLYDVEDETAVMLNQIATRPGMAFEYDYDYDDKNDWRHEIVLEEILQPETGVQYPVCIAGARAHPPKDCGGFEGYAHSLRALSDPDHEDHEETLEWIGGEFDSEKFDLKAVNSALKNIMKA